MRTPCLLAVALMLGHSVGCVSNVRPLSDEHTSTPDLRLLGTWEATQTDPDNRLKVAIRPKANSNTVLQATVQQGGKTETWDLFCTKIGDNYFASTAQEGDKEYTINKYELSDKKTLKILPLDTQFFEAAVADKRLKGSITSGGPCIGGGVSLDEPAQNLRTFLEKYGEKCVGKGPPITLVRIKDAE